MKTEWVGKNQLKKFAKRHIINNVDSVLDIGCGINPQKLISTEVHVCCEPYEEYVQHLQKKTSKSRKNKYIILGIDWENVVKIFPPKSVDSVVLYDVIEHLSKKEGKKLLRKTEKIARKQVVIFTPLGYIKQDHPDGKDAWGLGGTKWQEHHSGWEPSDFDGSWKIIACKNYHFVSQLQEELEVPHGAFYAIKTFSYEKPPREVGKKISFIKNKIYKKIFKVAYNIKMSLWKKPIKRKKK